MTESASRSFARTPPRTPSGCANAPLGGVHARAQANILCLELYDIGHDPMNWGRALPERQSATLKTALRRDGLRAKWSLRTAPSTPSDGVAGGAGPENHAELAEKPRNLTEPLTANGLEPRKTPKNETTSTRPRQTQNNGRSVEKRHLTQPKGESCVSVRPIANSGEGGIDVY